jgi:hypothetical protein
MVDPKIWACALDKIAIIAVTFKEPFLRHVRTATLLVRGGDERKAIGWDEA